MQLFLFRIHKIFCKARQTLSSSLSLTERVRIHKRRLPWPQLLCFVFLSNSLLPKHHFRHTCREHLCLNSSTSVPYEFVYSFEAKDTASLQHLAPITSRVLLAGKCLAFLQFCFVFLYFKVVMPKQLSLSLIWCCHKLIPAIETSQLERQLHLKFSMNLTGFKKRKK